MKFEEHWGGWGWAKNCPDERLERDLPVMRMFTVFFVLEIVARQPQSPRTA